MLKQLYIKNFALIGQLDMEFRQGFSVITGETGAGKSIILGAIALLLGQRADSKTVKAGCDKCIIEAHFDLSRYDFQKFFDDNDIEFDPEDCIIRRELTAAGKSRAFINDTPTPLSTLKELGENLVDVHSQHQNLLLGKQDFQRNVVDIIARNHTLLEQYGKEYLNLKDAERRLDDLRNDIERNRQNADFLAFQLRELTEASLTEGEKEELEQRNELLSHSEDIKTALYEADNLLSADEARSVTSNLKAAENALNRISGVLADAAELSQRLNSCAVEAKDIAEEVNSLLNKTEFDPNELDKVNERLDTIYSLEKKYKVQSVEELISLQQDLQLKINNIENSDEALDELAKEVEEKRQVCQAQADKLTVLREKAARTIEKEMQQRLMTLGMPNVRFEVKTEKGELDKTGQDKIDFQFSANTSTAPQPVATIASGGEIARVMLSLKAMISGAVKLPTIIFDEIDTGVSGKIAEKMANIMREMGDNERQVISITHLPQIAALGTTHYKVFKEETAQGTTSQMTMLDEGQRIGEIAQMLSGSDITEAAISNAKELLNK